MRKNATFIFFLGIKPEENAVKAAKNGKKVAQKQGGLSILSPNAPKAIKPYQKKSPRIGDINFSYFLYFIFQHITKKKGRNKFAPVVADKCINFKKRDNLQNKENH